MLIKLEGTFLYLYNPKPFPTRKMITIQNLLLKGKPIYGKKSGQIKPNKTIIYLLHKIHINLIEITQLVSLCV